MPWLALLVRAILQYPVAVCNPLTGEFINLPPVFNYDDNGRFADCVLGFSPKTNQYKVFRVFTRKAWRDGGTITEVHTLGTDSWRRVANAPNSIYKLAFPTYLDGALYCFCINDKVSDCIISFNFDDEHFKPLPLPPSNPERITNLCLSMGVLGGELCVCDPSEFRFIHVWVMTICSVSKSWTKLFSIDQGLVKWPYGLYQPINYYKNGSLLMFRNYASGLLFSDQECSGWKYLRLTGLKRYEIIAYTPSFVSLKDILVGHDVKVLDVDSRKLTLPGETRAPFFKRTELGFLDTYAYKFEEYYWTKHLWGKY